MQPQVLNAGVPQPLGNSADALSWFRAIDQNGNGRISVQELRTAMSSSGNKFSASAAEKLLAMHDRDNRGDVGYEEFQQLHQFIQAMQNGFRQRDTSGDGRLDGSEVRAALAAGGYTLGEETFQGLMRKFDRQKRGSLGFDDYIELSIFLSKARNTFSFYDRQRTGQVTFSFDMFVAGGTAVL